MPGYKAVKYLRLFYTDDKTTEIGGVAAQRKLIGVFLRDILKLRRQMNIFFMTIDNAIFNRYFHIFPVMIENPAAIHFPFASACFHIYIPAMFWQLSDSLFRNSV